MSKPNPADLKYTKEHEWAKDNGDGTVTMGITDHAQEMLTDIVFADVPAAGKKAEQMKAVAVLESVKSVSDVYAPVNGEVLEGNSALSDEPGIINKDAFGNGWICKIKMSNPTDLDKLMTAAQYDEYVKTASH
jgi:glycine cleavage system H protein